MGRGRGRDCHHPPQAVPGAGHHRLQAVSHSTGNLSTANQNSMSSMCSQSKFNIRYICVDNHILTSSVYR